jgi:hypothetical protein
LDNDGTPDSTDTDRDGDGVLNDADAFPDNASETTDTDNDGTGNNADLDDDNDGYSDLVEIAEGSNPLDASSKPADLDNDGTPDSTDTDRDGDGVLNDADAFPDNASETTDTDNDGTGNNADLDDDNDGYSDLVEIAEGSNPLDASSKPADLDNDGTPDSTDTDRDGDGVLNDADAFPDNASETTDTDNDGTGNNADLDDDNDGYSDLVEIAEGSNPLDASSKPADLDNDGTPDSTDTDRDGDGVLNDADAFPDNASETTDTITIGINRVWYPITILITRCIIAISRVSPYLRLFIITNTISIGIILWVRIFIIKLVGYAIRIFIKTITFNRINFTVTIRVY